jgi:CTP synthase
MVARLKNPKDFVKIALVGKYVSLPDAYFSVSEALYHAGIANSARVEIKYVNAEDLETNAVEDYILDADGVLVPGGFGDRGTEGKVRAIRYARERKNPMLGICLGMQLACVEFARNVIGLQGANSPEFDPGTRHPVIDLLPEQKNIADLGGTMRLGGYPCHLVPGSRAHRAYGDTVVIERHRHRYEFNNEYRGQFMEWGMQFTGLSPDGRLVEIIELADHPWFVATQFHPEFKSRPNRPHPLFRDFVGAALRNRAD